MLRIFVKGPLYSTFRTAKYEYATQNIFFVKSKCGQSTPVDTTLLLPVNYGKRPSFYFLQWYSTDSKT